MRKRTKRWILIAVALMAAGLTIFTVVMTVNGWDFRKLSTVEYETNAYQVSGEFQSISVNTDTADVSLALSNDGICRVVCYEEEKVRHTVAVVDGVLTVRATNEKEWYDYIGIGFNQPRVTVYLPEQAYAALTVGTSTGDVVIPKELSFKNIDASTSTGEIWNYASASELIKLKAGTGDLCVSGIAAGSMDLSVSTGEIEMRDVTCEGDVTVKVGTGETELSRVTCKNLYSTGSTGEISLEGVIAKERFSIERSTGDVELERCDAGEIFIKTSTGDVEGSLLSDKIFYASSNTGEVLVPRTNAGGRCEITCSTGDIEIVIRP